MTTIWMAIAPDAQGTRVLATRAGHETLLTARLARDPAHPRALPWRLEALALWQGQPVRAALCAAASDASCASTLYHGLFDAAFASPLYTLALAPPPPRARARRGEPRTGLGAFADLRRALVAEVAR